MTVDQKDEKTLIGPSPTLTGSNLNGVNGLNTNPFGGIFEHSATGTDAIQHQLSRSSLIKKSFEFNNLSPSD